jgi:hypothetical protein
MTMSDVIYMDKETRIAQVLAEVGESAALQNPGAVYPALQAPDPSVGRFRKPYPAPFEIKSPTWVDVSGDMPEFNVEKGWFNVGSSAELRFDKKLPKTIPEIIRITHGLCCSMKAAAVMQAVDPEGVTVASLKLVADGGARVEPYALVGVNRRIDIVNWAQAPISLSYLDVTSKWLASSKGKYGEKPDVDPSIHIVLSIGYMFSVDLIEALRDAGVKGCDFVNEADRRTSHKL